MITMQEYINNVKNKTDINQNTYKSVKCNPLTTSNVSLNLKPDSFEKENSKTHKKEIFKIGAIAAGVVSAILAFLKRKRIGNALSGLFNKKKPPEPPAPPAGNIPNTPKTPPAKPAQTTEPTTSTLIPPKQTELPKHPNIPTLEEYTKLKEEFEELRKLDISDPKRKAAAQKLNALEKQMIEQNVSFAPKPPESFASDKERWDYFFKGINCDVKNEATAMDILDQFGKLGGKMYDKNTGWDSLTDISRASLIYATEGTKDVASSNRILQKYIDSVFKFATKEIPPRGYSPDAHYLMPSYDNARDVMTKDTVIKFIDAFKNIAVDKQQYHDIKYFLKEDSWQLFYPQLKAEDLPDIQKALDEFGAAVKDLPDDLWELTREYIYKDGKYIPNPNNIYKNGKYISNPNKRNNLPDEN